MKTTETACVSDELCCLLKEEEDGQIVSLDDSRMECVRGHLVILSMLTIRVVLEYYSLLHKKAYNLVVCEFGGFELRDAGIRGIPT